MRNFVGIDLGREPAPDETTNCKFRHILEANNLGERLFKLIREYLAENGLKVTSGAKLIHSVVATPANVHDTQALPRLLHGDETRVWGDAAYTGQGDVIRKYAPLAKDFTQKKSCRDYPLSEAERSLNRTKSKVRAKVEHPFLVLKRIFGFCKTRCRGIMKNVNRLFVVCGLTNLYMVRRRLLGAT